MQAAMCSFIRGMSSYRVAATRFFQQSKNCLPPRPQSTHNKRGTVRIRVRLLVEIDGHETTLHLRSRCSYIRRHGTHGWCSEDKSRNAVTKIQMHTKSASLMLKTVRVTL